MAADDPPGPPAPLQFDRVDAAQPEGDATARQAGVTCRACGTAIRTQYFSMGAATLCERCKTVLEASRDASAEWSTFGRAVVFGLGAAVAGAVIYYAVLAITKLEIGLVAILIGYMVGWAVRRGSRGWGGRRYQLLALVLTYYSVGLAYFPILVQQMQVSKPAAVSTSRAGPAPAPAEAGPRRVSPGRLAASVGLVLLLCFALPVLSVVGSMPGGLISAVIIGVGLRQAWRMTAAPPIEVSGPYQIGAEAPTA